MRILTVAALALALTACGSQSMPQQVDSNPGVQAPVSPLAFGTAHTWPTGDTITVTNPARSGNSTVVLTVTYHNGSQAVESVYGIDSVFVITANVDGSDLQPMFIPNEPTPTSNLLPGRTVTYRQAFTLPHNGPIDLQVQAVGSMNNPTRPVVFYEGTV